MQIPKNGLSAWTCATIGSTRPRARNSRIASSKAPTPGSTTRSDSATRCGSSLMRASTPIRSSAFCTLRRFPLP